MADAALRPVTIEVERQAALRICWGSGDVSAVPLEVLRQACPCAACRTAREEASRTSLPIVPAADEQTEMSRVADVTLVGHYALRIRWGDGHETGIYDFRLLRALSTTSKSERI
jgi:DUF971 family protein